MPRIVETDACTCAFRGLACGECGREQKFYFDTPEVAAPPAIACSAWLDELLTLYDDAGAAKWLSSPHKLLNGKSALQAIRDGEGEKVARIVEQLTTGAFIGEAQGSLDPMKRKSKPKTRKANAPKRKRLRSSDSLERLVSLGDYVLATKYADANPNDPWRVGFVVRIIDTWRRERTYVIGEADGTWTDFREYKHARKITQQEGREWVEANSE